MATHTAVDAYGQQHHAATVELLTASVELVEALVNTAVDL